MRACVSRPSSAEVGIHAAASKHVDFSLAPEELAHGAGGVNEVVFDGEDWGGGGGGRCG